MPDTTIVNPAGKLGAMWCELVHDSPMWPIHGEYQCRTCGRRYPVPWARESMARVSLAPAFRPAPNPSER